MQGNTNESSPSTTIEWEWVKIEKAAKAHRQRAERVRSTAKRLPLVRREARKPTTWLVRWRGGPQCWVEVRARGRVWRFPGFICIADVLLFITDSDEGRAQASND